MFGRPIDYGCPVAEHPLNRGLVGWWLGLPRWSGASRLFDITTKRNHGTLTNGPTWATGPNGFGALSLDGSDDCVTFNSIDLSGGAVTYAAWVRLATVAGQQSIVSNRRTYLQFNGTDLRWFPNTASTVVVAATPVAAGQWAHVVVAQSGTAYGIYFNGLSVGAGTTVAIDNTVDGNSWGRYLAADVRPLGGLVADPIAYTRGLSAGEVATLYDQSRRGYPDLLRRSRTFTTTVGPGSAGPVGDGSGTSTGVCVATGVGQSTAQGYGSSAGVASPAGAGAPSASGSGSSAGTASCAASGQSSAAGVSACSGSAACSGSSQSTGSCSASASGSASVAGVGQSTAAGFGSSAGSSTCTGSSQSPPGAVGSAAGSAACTGVGQSTAAGYGSADGSCAVNGRAPLPGGSGNAPKKTMTGVGY